MLGGDPMEGDAASAKAGPVRSDWPAQASHDPRGPGRTDLCRTADDVLALASALGRRLGRSAR
jgi:hypothetical protein